MNSLDDLSKRIYLKENKKINTLINFLSNKSKSFIYFLSNLKNFIFKTNNISLVNKTFSNNKIKKNTTINCIEESIFTKSFNFFNKTAKEIMTSRMDTTSIDINDDLNDIFNILLNCKYSRIPVFDKSIDNIIGILHKKDLVSYMLNNNLNSINLKEILHPPFFIPETKKIDEVFISLKENKAHISVLVDEYGGFSGIVTLEDITEEIVSNLNDHYIYNNKIKQISNDCFEIKGNISLCDFNNFFNENLKSNDFDTINGYIISLINKVPTTKENIIVNVGKYELRVVEIEDNRIEKINVRLLNKT